MVATFRTVLITRGPVGEGAAAGRLWMLSARLTALG